MSHIDNFRKRIKNGRNQGTSEFRLKLDDLQKVISEIDDLVNNLASAKAEVERLKNKLRLEKIAPPEVLTVNVSGGEFK